MAVNAFKTRSLFYDKIKFTEERIDKQAPEAAPGKT